jgi:hypothetical protein
MVKIFGIGLSRTGSLSLRDYMSASGYSSVHYVIKPHWLGLPQEIVRFCEGHDFINDAPVSIYFEELSQAFPGSKFINTTRNLGSWLKSCSQHFVRNLKQRKPCRAALKYRELLYGCDGYNKTKFTKAFHRHKQKVSKFSKNNNVLTLRLELEDQRKIGLLKTFLGDDDLSPRYPHVNDLADKAMRRAGQEGTMRWV